MIFAILIPLLLAISASGEETKKCTSCSSQEPKGVEGFNKDDIQKDSNGCLVRNITCFKPNYVTYKSSLAIVSQSDESFDFTCSDEGKWVERGEYTISEVGCNSSVRPPKSKEVCKLPGNPQEEITCLAYFPMYYFDGKTNKCVRFIYGGCGGNENRFETKEECEKTCFEK